MNDTICAIATPYGVGSISIIRLSGDESVEIVNKIFKGANLTKKNTHTVSYGHIYDEDDLLYEVLVSIFLAPRSFTKENVVEIGCHGGVYVTNRILETLCKNGARLANPGEFTKRAFLNGRIDLTQAEAIMDLISAENETALNMANDALNKSTKKLIDDLKEVLIEQIGKIEVNIDYPEYDDVEIMTNEIVKPKLLDMSSMMDKILEKSKISQVFSTGIKTCIVGRPNVGKSSLLNLLLNEEKAIVSNIAGTTRDIVEGKLNIGGVTLNLLDTAGIRNTDDYVEAIGVEKAKELIKTSELVILVLDGSEKLNKVDLELLSLTENKMRIIIINKEDKGLQFDIKDAIKMSTLSAKGLDILEDEIIKLTKKEALTDKRYLTNKRHITLLNNAKKSLDEAIKSIEISMPIDVVEIDLKACWNYLLEITGEVSSEKILDELFSRFCLGK